MKSKFIQAQRLLDKGPESADRVISLLKPLIATHGDSALLHAWFGRAYRAKGEQTTALGLFQKALQLKSDLGSLEWEVRLEASRCAFRLGDASLAETHIKESILKRRDHLESWLHLAEIYRSQGELNKALATLGKANKVDSSSSEVALQIARVYKDQGHFEKALEILDVVLQMDTTSVDARLKKADILQILQKVEMAEEELQEILRRNPGHLKAGVSLGTLLTKSGKLQRAREQYEELLRLHPDHTQARANYAFVLMKFSEFNESERQYRRAIETNPYNRSPFSSYLMGLHYNPERTANEILEEHHRWNRMYIPPIHSQCPKPEDLDRDRRLRIGVLSGGFRKHPVGWMVTTILESLREYEDLSLYFYSTHSKTDEISKRLFETADVWRTVVGYSEQRIVQMMREDQIDILFELSGHAADNRLQSVALGAAPVNIKWVGGLFNTTGMDGMDFLLSDGIETPDGVDDLYTEKLIRMPNDYICFMPPDYAPEVESLPALTNGHVTFGCFNNPSKINTEILHRWALILLEVQDSHFLLKGHAYRTPEIVNRHLEVFERAGVSRDRILFERGDSHANLLRSYNRIDIALDPWPYSGGLTTCEALWMGVPVITHPGPTFAGRHSATHLTNAGYPEWVCNSWDRYIETAVRLASDVEVLSNCRSGLRERVANSPLCDAPGYASVLHRVIREVWGQRIDGYHAGDKKWAQSVDLRDRRKS